MSLVVTNGDVHSNSDGDLNAEDKSFKPRRAHKKSRGGCLACKRRRIKCGEGKPKCVRCIKLSLECVYPVPDAKNTAESSFASALASRTPSPSTRCYNMAVTLSQTQLRALFQSQTFCDPTLDSLRDLHLLQHFQTITCATLGSPLGCSVLQKSAARLAWGNPHLMHMVLAISAAHMKRLTESNDNSAMMVSYDIVEAKHWHHALKLFQAKISSPKGIKGEFDSYMATTVLSTYISYAIDDEIPQDAFSNPSEEVLSRALSPLGATSGFRVLRPMFGEIDPQSSWIPVFRSSDDKLATFTNKAPGTSGMPRAFVDLCGLHEMSSSDNNPYHCLLRLLTPLLKLPYDASNSAKLMAYMVRTWLDYKPLLMKRDPIALLMLAYWFGLLLQIDQWWVERRARTECIAIVAHLSKDSDPRIRSLLFFPASLGTADLSSIW